MQHGSTQTPVFARGSNVLDYWIAHAEGFRLTRRGRRSVRVESVVVEPSAGHARALIVRSHVLGRRRLVPAEAIAGVDPSAGVLHLERPARRHVRVSRLVAIRPAATAAASRAAAVAAAARSALAEVRHRWSERAAGRASP